MGRRLKVVCRAMKKHIDIKSLLIGIFLASTVLLAIGATSPTDKWDRGQVWEVTSAREHGINIDLKKAWAAAAFGAEPFAVVAHPEFGRTFFFRKRVK